MKDGQDRPRIGVAGVGAVGSVLSACLLAAGHDLVLIDPDDGKRAELVKHGLALLDPRGAIGGDIEARPRLVLKDVSQLEAHPVEVLFVCVKVAALQAFMAELAGAWGQGAGKTLVSFQNGLDTERELAEAFPAAVVLRVVVNYASNILSHRELRVSFFHPPNFIGAVQRRDQATAEAIAKILTEARLRTEFRDDLALPLWTKVILNSALCTVTALTGMTMAQAMEFEPTRAIVRELLLEGIAVAAALGVGLPPEFYEQCVDYLMRAGHHKASMLVDVERGNRTEIDYLNGKIIAYGDTLGVATPHHLFVTRLIKGIEQRIRDARDPGHP